jgi:hypothetical protein
LVTGIYGEAFVPVTAKLSRKFYEALGDDVANELVEWFNQVDATYRGELRQLNDLNFARFDAKVGERFAQVDARFAEFGANVDRRFAEFDAVMERRFARLEALLERRLGETKSELIRWSFAFWVGTALAVIGLKVF